jgi:hypothetical protein
MWLPLPLRIYVLLGHVVGDVIFRAHVPVRSHDASQIPELQIGVPPVTAGHTLPHVPQLLAVVSGVSQPFGRLVSQSPQPVLQLGVHNDDAQLVVPCAFVHAVPHIPQLLLSVRRETSQPFVGMVSQLA